mmetsp:Transcript_8622/g.11618  ORF Transcript_8622/g.11618 Transcript_8622/m.11618 type:complete len:247 (-) Transcript_8622:447-1187(-)
MTSSKSNNRSIVCVFEFTFKNLLLSGTKMAWSSTSSIIPIVKRSVSLWCLILHGPKIPKFNTLIFTIRNKVTTIPFRINVSNTIQMTNHDPTRLPLRLPQQSTIPNFTKSIIRPRKHNISRLIRPLNCINIISVGCNFHCSLFCLLIINIQTIIRSTSQDLSVIGRKFDGEETKTASFWSHVVACMVWIWDFEIINPYHMNTITPRRICKIFSIRAIINIDNRPTNIPCSDSTLKFPFGSIINTNS